MHALVTGAAGFIGSTLAERLLGAGWTVRGVDCFTPYYDESAKRAHLSGLLSSPQFTLIEKNLLVADLKPLLDGVDVVFHLSGQPGVRLSWAEGFRTYNDLNVNVTQRLLEAARAADLRRFVYAYSSSIYGDAAVVPTDEDQPTRPYSPYGVTKLAGELLCTAYGANLQYYSLDNAGNRVGEQVKDVQGNLQRSITRVYDALNRVQQVTGAAN